MRLAQWTKDIQKKSNYITSFRGFNATENHQEGELAECYGLSTENFPCLSPRRGRAEIPFENYVSDIFEWDGKLIVVSGGLLYYDGEVLTSVNDKPKQFAVVNTKLIVWPDKIIVDTQNKTFEPMDKSVDATVDFTENSITGPATKIELAKGTSMDIRWNSAGDMSFYDCTDTPAKKSVDKISSGMKFIPAKDNNSYTLVTGENGANPDTSKYNTEGAYSVITDVEYREVKATAGTNYIRSGPGFNYSTIGTIAAGETVKLVGTSGEWRRIIKGTVCGWVASGTITPNDNPYIRIKYDTFKDGSGEVTAFDMFATGDVVDIVGEGLEKTQLKVSTVNGSTITFASNEDGTMPFADIIPLTNKAITVRRFVPDMDFICSSANRLWGVSSKDKTIRCSALGLPERFCDIEGVSLDSYAVAVGSEGDWTGIVAYGGSVLCFKQNYMHKVMGSYPAEFYITEYTIPGIQAGSHKSAQIINNVLYYKGDAGVYSFAGSTPSLISYKLGNTDYHDAVGGTDGINYYISMKSDRDRTFVLDMTHGIWTVYEDEYASGFTNMSGSIYSLINGKVLDISADSDEAVEWFARFTPFLNVNIASNSTGPIVNRKGLTKLILRMDMEIGSSVKVELSEDGGEWRTVLDYTHESKFKTKLVPIRIGRCDKFEIRMSGTGKTLVRTLYREYAVGSDR